MSKSRYCCALGFVGLATSYMVRFLLTVWLEIAGLIYEEIMR